MFRNYFLYFIFLFEIKYQCSIFEKVLPLDFGITIGIRLIACENRPLALSRSTANVNSRGTSFQGAVIFFVTFVAWAVPSGMFPCIFNAFSVFSSHRRHVGARHFCV